MVAKRRKSGALKLRGIGLPMVSVKEESGSMFLHRKTPAIAAAAFVVSLFVAGAICPAPAGSSTLTKVSVPKHIITGSSVTTGRTFYKPTMYEDTLAGIRLGREAKEVLSKWGNPSSISVGGSGGDAGPVVPQLAPAYTPAPGGVNPYEGLAAGINQAMSRSGMQNQFTLPPLPGFGAPGIPPPAAPGADRSSGEVAGLSEDEVVWTYTLNGGITLEFIITGGLVTQITVGGTGPWSLSKTRTGLQLGDTYKLAVWVCGYPESQKYVSNRFLRVSYVNKSRVVYTFLNNKLVGVTIALVPTEIKI